MRSHLLFMMALQSLEKTSHDAFGKATDFRGTKTKVAIIYLHVIKNVCVYVSAEVILT